MSKYLEIEKMYYNGSDYVWYLSIKDGYKDSYKSRKKKYACQKIGGHI